MWPPLPEVITRNQGAHAGAPLQEPQTTQSRWVWGPSLDFDG
jgi:hypothetical protein